jgi:hypothetical protein
VIINGSNQFLEPADDGANVLAYSAVVHPVNERCSKLGVSMNGSGNQWRGFIYAPFSMIKMDGSTGSALTGSLIGWSIKISGQALNNTADPSFFAGPPVLRLVE